MTASESPQTGEIGAQIVLALLDWPVLAFVLILCFLLLFRAKIFGLLDRGDISFSWGNCSIQLKELSNGIDQELAPVKE